MTCTITSANDRTSGVALKLYLSARKSSAMSRICLLTFVIVVVSALPGSGGCRGWVAATAHSTRTNTDARVVLTWTVRMPPPLEDDSDHSLPQTSFGNQVGFIENQSIARD